jgi:hypothetical protein
VKYNKVLSKNNNNNERGITIFNVSHLFPQLAFSKISKFIRALGEKKPSILHQLHPSPHPHQLHSTAQRHHHLLLFPPP